MRTKTITGFLVLAILVVGTIAILQEREGGIKIRADSAKRFSSYNELAEYVNKSAGYGNYYFGGRILANEQAGIPSMATKEAAGSESRDSAGGSSDFSKTNIQIEGVDEPDIVKNDGKYIYAVVGNKVVIVDAYPADEMKVLSEINFNKSISNIFINGDKLVAFSNDYSYYPVMEKTDVAVDSRGAGVAADVSEASIIAPEYRYSEPRSIVYVYDISNKEKPSLDDEFSVEGSYYDSRMIGDYVYVISTKYINLNYINPPVFIANGIERKVAATEIAYFDNPDTNYVFSSIMAINLENGEFTSEVYLTGGTSSLFVSENNIYLTYQKRIGYEDYSKRLIEDVYLKILPADQGIKVNAILNKDKISYTDIREVQEIFEKHYNALKGQERADFDKNFMKVLNEFEIKISKETEKTAIHKISIDEEEINYEGVGEVPGNVLNQFSMDENDGYFRIATTTGNSWQETSFNHLYVLDENLEIVGKVEDLAKGERIYSTRFIGDRAYMVTFKQVDPLFVIDLSNPAKPEVLGYLKVTGFSNYLHPYDENHIIGVGREASEQGRAQGVKLALFDVSDVKAPKEISKYEIKEGWSDSNALYDHKAFLFSKEKGLLAIPITHTQHIGGEYKYWQGAYVFKLNLNDGISLKGEISHDTGDKYGNYNNAVQRSLYMGDVLYTISLSKIKANSLGDLQEIKDIELPYKEDRVYGYGVID